MNLKLKLKIEIGETVFVVFRPRNVSFDDALPIVEMQLEGIKLSGNYYDDKDNKIDIVYILKEKGGFATAHEREDRIFKTREDAYEKAISLVEKDKNEAKETLSKCELILTSHNNTSVNSEK